MSGFLSGRTSLTTVQTADIAANAITLAKLAGGTDGNIISFDASGDPVAIATGSDGQALHSAGAGAQPAFETVSAGFTLGTEQATTSGTTFTFGSIPSGVTQIDVMFNEVSTDAVADSGKAILVQLGDAGGIETSGYLSASVNAQAYYNYDDYGTTGMIIYMKAGTAEEYKLISGTMSFYLEDASAFTWVQTHTMKMKNAAGPTAGTGYGTSLGGGVKSLSAELTQLMILNEAADDFDAGAINIKYM